MFTNPKHQAFADECIKAAETLPGWFVHVTKSSNPAYAPVMHCFWHCPHGGQSQSMLSIQLIEMSPVPPEVLVQQLHGETVHRCMKEHYGKPVKSMAALPPGIHVMDVHVNHMPPPMHYFFGKAEPQMISVPPTVKVTFTVEATEESAKALYDMLQQPVKPSSYSLPDKYGSHPPLKPFMAPADAAAAVGIDQFVRKHVPAVMDEEVQCPEPTCKINPTAQRSIWSAIQHLNDAHKWPREQIADWLDTLDVDLTINAEPKGA